MPLCSRCHSLQATEALDSVACHRGGSTGVLAADPRANCPQSRYNGSNPITRARHLLFMQRIASIVPKGPIQQTLMLTLVAGHRHSIGQTSTGLGGGAEAAQALYPSALLLAPCTVQPVMG